MEKIRISTGPSASPGTDNPKRLMTESAWSSQRPRRTAARMPAGRASARASANAVRCQGQRVGIALRYEVGDCVVEADGAAQVAVQHAVPIMEILPPKRLIEAVLMAQGRQVRVRCALAQHLLDGIAGNQVNEQKHQRDHQPDDGKREGEAGEGLLHGLDSTINQDIGSGIAGQRSVIRESAIRRQPKPEGTLRGEQAAKNSS